MKFCFSIIGCTFFLCAIAFAQTTNNWNEKKCAVVLTYDDGLNVHLTNVIPALDTLGIKGTFYISDYFGGLKAQIDGWRKAAAHGHELGNHTTFHPCLGNLPGRSFVPADYDLSKYSIRRITDEIRNMNTILKSIDGKSGRTFAYPCGDMKIGDSFYLNGMKNEFVAARGVRPAILSMQEVDLYNISCYGVNDQSGDELISFAKQAMEKNGLLVFLFHGVGGEHSLNVSLEAHRQLLRFLKQNEKSIWIATMIDVSKFILNKQH